MFEATKNIKLVLTHVSLAAREIFYHGKLNGPLTLFYHSKCLSECQINRRKNHKCEISFLHINTLHNEYITFIAVRSTLLHLQSTNSFDSIRWQSKTIMLLLIKNETKLMPITIMLIILDVFITLKILVPSLMKMILTCMTFTKPATR